MPRANIGSVITVALSSVISTSAAPTRFLQANVVGDRQCTVESCCEDVYHWVAPDFPACPEGCGQQQITQTRTVTCMNGAGSASTSDLPHASYCTEKKPVTSRVCPATAECPYRWHVDEPTCPETCGKSEHEIPVTVECWKPDHEKYANKSAYAVYDDADNKAGNDPLIRKDGYDVVDNQFCAPWVKPSTVKVCQATYPCDYVWTPRPCSSRTECGLADGDAGFDCVKVEECTATKACGVSKTTCLGNLDLNNFDTPAVGSICPLAAVVAPSKCTEQRPAPEKPHYQCPPTPTCQFRWVELGFPACNETCDTDTYSVPQTVECRQETLKVDGTVETDRSKWANEGNGSVYAPKYCADAGECTYNTADGSCAPTYAAQCAAAISAADTVAGYRAGFDVSTYVDSQLTVAGEYDRGNRKGEFANHGSLNAVQGHWDPLNIADERQRICENFEINGVRPCAFSATVGNLNGTCGAKAVQTCADADLTSKCTRAAHNPLDPPRGYSPSLASGRKTFTPSNPAFTNFFAVPNPNWPVTNTTLLWDPENFALAIQGARCAAPEFQASPSLYSNYTGWSNQTTATECATQCRSDTSASGTLSGCDWSNETGYHGGYFAHSGSTTNCSEQVFAPVLAYSAYPSGSGVRYSTSDTRLDGSTVYSCPTGTVAVSDGYSYYTMYNWHYGWGPHGAHGADSVKRNYIGVAVDKPRTSDNCPTRARCQYRWHKSNWNSCTTTCDTPTHDVTRTVTCEPYNHTSGYTDEMETVTSWVYADEPDRLVPTNTIAAVTVAKRQVQIAQAESCSYKNTTLAGLTLAQRNASAECRAIADAAICDSTCKSNIASMTSTDTPAQAYTKATTTQARLFARCVYPRGAGVCPSIASGQIYQNAWSSAPSFSDGSTSRQQACERTDGTNARDAAYHCVYTPPITQVSKCEIPARNPGPTSGSFVKKPDVISEIRVQSSVTTPLQLHCQMTAPCQFRWRAMNYTSCDCTCNPWPTVATSIGLWEHVGLSTASGTAATSSTCAVAHSDHQMITVGSTTTAVQPSTKHTKTRAIECREYHTPGNATGDIDLVNGMLNIDDPTLACTAPGKASAEVTLSTYHDGTPQIVVKLSVAGDCQVIEGKCNATAQGVANGMGGVGTGCDGIFESSDSQTPTTSRCEVAKHNPANSATWTYAPWKHWAVEIPEVYVSSNYPTNVYVGYGGKINKPAETAQCDVSPNCSYAWFREPFPACNDTCDTDPYVQTSPDLECHVTHESAVYVAVRKAQGGNATHPAYFAHKNTPGCTNTCDQQLGVFTEYVGNGVCEDGGPGSVSSACPRGTDCLDCGERTTDWLSYHKLGNPGFAPSTSVAAHSPHKIEDVGEYCRAADPSGLNLCQVGYADGLGGTDYVQLHDGTQKTGCAGQG